MRKWLMAAALIVATGSGAAADGAKLVISKTVQASFESYQQGLTAIGAGAYAVTEDGLGGAGAGCPQANCMNASRAAERAIQRCEKANPGRKCIIFAKNRETIIPYGIAE